MRVHLTRSALLSLVVVATIASGRGTTVAAAAPIPLTSCVPDLVRPRTALAAAAAPPAARPVGQVRQFEKLDLTIGAGATADGAIQIEARTGDLGFRKKLQSDGRYTLDLEVPGDRISIGVTENGVTVERSGTTIAVSPEMSQSQLADVRRMFADSRAIDLLRAAGADIEASEEDSAAVVPLVLADSLVGTLTGDVGAARRAARLLSRRARAQFRPVQTRPNTCYQQWQNAVLWAYMDWEECVFLWDWWFGWCSLRWSMEVDSAWFQFITCSGFGF